jgi:hypothetical protein
VQRGGELIYPSHFQLAKVERKENSPKLDFRSTEFSEIERGPEREIGKQEGEVLPGGLLVRGAEV